MSKDAYLHIKDLPFTSSQIDLPYAEYAKIVLVSEDRLYAVSKKNLSVYLMSDLKSSISTIPIELIYSCIIINNHLYLGGTNQLHVFELTPSLTHPLTPISVITTSSIVYKILRVGNELLLG
jgi:hypothetical protein